MCAVKIDFEESHYILRPNLLAAPFCYSTRLSTIFRAIITSSNVRDRFFPPINSRQQGEQRSPFELASRLRVIRSVTVSSFRVSNPARWLVPTTLPVLYHAFHHYYPPLEFRMRGIIRSETTILTFLRVEIELLETTKKEKKRCCCCRSTTRFSARNGTNFENIRE